MTEEFQPKDPVHGPSRKHADTPGVRTSERAAKAFWRAVTALTRIEPVLLVVAISLGTIYLLAIGESRLSFHSDECVYLGALIRQSPIDWLRPYNEHWTTLTIAAWALLTEIFGTGSYLPFRALLLAAHATAVVALWALIRPHQPVLALPAAILFLMLGAGHENLLFAVQIQVTGAMAAGLWAVWAATRDRMLLAASLLTVALMFQTTALLFLPAVGAALATRRRWQSMLWLAIPSIAFVAWFVTFGRQGVARPLFDEQTIGRVVPWMLVSLADAFSDTFGIRLAEGLSTVVAGAAVLVVAALLRGWRPPPVAMAAIVGLISGYGVIGLGRAPGVASSRYVYIASAMYLLALTALPRVRGVWAVVAVVVFVFALRYNYFELQSGLVAFEAYSRDPVRACHL